MNLIEVCVRRPVFATMLTVSLVVLGIASFRELGLDIFPKVDLPQITITTRLEGASPEEIESNITKKIEEVVNTISGVDELRSTTTEGQSQVFVQFILEKNADVAANEVREKVSTVVRDFPPGTDPPIIEKFDPDSAPIMAVVVSGNRSAREVTEIADKRIKRQLETVKDIGAVTLVGDRKREIQVEVDPHRLSAYSLSIQQVKDALLRQNAEVPGGRITWEANEQGLRTLGRIERPEEFNHLIVATHKGAPVRVRDLGRAVDGEEEPRTLARLNGQNAVSLLIRKQSGTNTVAVVDGVRAKLEQIRPSLPPDIQFQVVRDLSRFIRRSIAEVEHHLILGAVLASLIVLLFIRNLRTAIIAALAIPASIISTFTIMRYLGFTLNNVTLLGLSISTGIVIDDAIIVMENIFRHMEEEGRSPLEAAILGAKEIVLAVMATTLSLVVIFLPVAFMGGRVGRWWNSMGITASAAIMMSLLVAFSLTPMLCSRFLKAPPSSGGHGGGENARGPRRGVYARLEWAYETILLWCLRHRAITLALAACVLASTYWVGKAVKAEFIVNDDMSEFEVIVEAPPGSSLERTDQVLRQLEADLKTIPEVETLFTTIGVRGQNRSNITDGSIYVGLAHMSKRERGQPEIMQTARGLFRKYPDLRIAVQPMNLLSTGGQRQSEFQMVLRGPELHRLDEYGGRIIQRLSALPGFVDVDTGQAQRRPELQVRIDRQRASDLGVRVTDIAGALRTMVGGEKAGFFREGGEQYDVRLRLLEPYRKDESTVAELTVPSGSGRLVKLSNVTRLETGLSPAQVDRFAQERQISVLANLFGKPLGEAIQEANPVVRGLAMPAEYTTQYLGRGKLLAETFQNFLVAFILSLAFIYMVLAAQFESFIHPVTIMFSMFLSIPFGLLSLIATGQTLHIYSMMGLFVLMGVVKKNAILQVDYTNVLRARGMPRHEAQLEADRARLRPILMTTLAIIAGMLPVALGRGDGSASRAGLATVVVGGQTLCLLITLLVTPVIYSFFDDLRGLRVFGWLYEFKVWSRLKGAVSRPAGALGFAKHRGAP
jgi:HAE1 family hydrophobic/amphiphilic exporter-1